MNGVRRVFYDKTTGYVIQEIGRKGSFVLPSIEQEITTYTSLSERVRDSFDILEIPFTQYAQDFVDCNGYRVNPETKTLEFSYPDPNEPEVPSVYQEALSKQLERLKQEDLNNKEAIAELYMLSMGGF